MARPAGSKNKTTKAAAAPGFDTRQLTEAMAFVAVAGTKDSFPYQQHLILSDGWAVMTDGQITAGFPINEPLKCCPQLKLLTSAIKLCGQGLALVQMPDGRLAVTGDHLKAAVPCLALDAMPDLKPLQPDPAIAPLDDRMRLAFAACSPLVSEAGKRMIEAALLLEAKICTSTNGVVLLQYRHDIELPPNLVVPKLFATSVLKIKSPLKAFGYTHERSITFHFENGGWLKTQLYQDPYPNIQALFGQNFVDARPLPLGEDFFAAIETVAAFRADDAVLVSDGRICSHFEVGQGAEYSIEGLKADIGFNRAQTKLVALYADQMDMTTFDDRAVFFGECTRGVIMEYKLRDHPNPAEKTITMAEWQAAGSDPNTIPF